MKLCNSTECIWCTILCWQFTSGWTWKILNSTNLYGTFCIPLQTLRDIGMSTAFKFTNFIEFWNKKWCSQSFFICTFTTNYVSIICLERIHIHLDFVTQKLTFLLFSEWIFTNGDNCMKSNFSWRSIVLFSFSFLRIIRVQLQIFSISFLWVSISIVRNFNLQGVS